jgi:hypothetical protein
MKLHGGTMEKLSNVYLVFSETWITESSETIA